MLNNRFIVLAIAGVLYSVGINGAFASATTTTPSPNENIQYDAFSACTDRKQGDGCMYIQDDTKYTGTCQKENDKDDGKMHCRTIK